MQHTPLYGTLVGKGAVMGQIAGWERALWFQEDAVKDRGEAGLSFHGEPWHAAVRKECETVRDAVDVMDHGGFAKFTVTGPNSETALRREMERCGDPALTRMAVSG